MKTIAIVVTYNGLQWYSQCFSSLEASSIPLDIFVVDNASSDNTTDFIRKNFSNINLVCLSKNIGFGQANSMGMQYALDNAYNYVFLLNQDAWVEKDTIEKLVDVHQRNSQYGILSPVHLNATKTALEINFRNFATPQWGCNDFFSDLYCGRTKEVYETNFVNASAWLISRKCLQTVGYFDPIFFHYGEDDNYVYRANYHMFKVGIVPAARIVHDSERRIIAKVFVDNERRKNLLGCFCDIRGNDFKGSQDL